MIWNAGFFFGGQRRADPPPRRFLHRVALSISSLFGVRQTTQFTVSIEEGNVLFPQETDGFEQWLRRVHCWVRGSLGASFSHPAGKNENPRPHPAWCLRFASLLLRWCVLAARCPCATPPRRAVLFLLTNNLAVSMSRNFTVAEAVGPPENAPRDLDVEIRQ